MAKYNVRVTRMVYTTVVVEAHNMNEAKQKAIAISANKEYRRPMNEEPKADCVIKL